MGNSPVVGNSGLAKWGMTGRKKIDEELYSSLVDIAFSSIVVIKSKSRNRLIDLESDLRCAISSVEPNIDALVANKQAQKSH